MEAVNIYAEILKWKANKQGLVPVAIRIDLAGKRVATKSIPHRIDPVHWDPVKRRVLAANPDHALLNQILESQIQQYRTFVVRRQAFNLPVTAELLKLLADKGSGADDFYTIAEDVLETKRLKDGLGYDTETKRRYRDEIKRLQLYRAQLAMEQMTPEFLRQYRTWLQTTYRKKDKQLLSKNGIWNAFKFIRMVWNEAIERQLVLPEQNPFRAFKFDGYEQDTSKIKWLELDDLDRLERVLQTDRHLQQLTVGIGWRFLAMCVCGMRISDAMAFDEAFFNDAGDLEFRPHKTRRHNNRAQIPVVGDRQRKYFEQALAHPLPKTDYRAFALRSIFT